MTWEAETKVPSSSKAHLVGVLASNALGLKIRLKLNVEKLNKKRKDTSPT